MKSYLVHLNATQAARDAGYKGNDVTLGAVGNENLKKPLIADAVQREMDKRTKRVEVTADLVLGELLKIATADLSEIYDKDGNMKSIHDIPEATRKAMSGLEVTEVIVEGDEPNTTSKRSNMRVKFWDKTKALEALGRHLKLFTDRTEVDSKIELKSSDALQAVAELTSVFNALKHERKG